MKLSELPTPLLEEIRNLSTNAVIEIPIRQKGITSGTPNECWVNANIVSQTYGGKVVYGWIIQPTYDFITSRGKREYPDKFNGFGIWGHAVWETPEGTIVDVTPNDRGDKERMFLPYGYELKINEKVLLKDFLFLTTKEEFKIIAFRKGRVPSEEIIEWFEEGKHHEKYEKYLNTLIEVNCMQKDDFFDTLEILKSVEKQLGGKDFISKVILAPRIRVVDSNTIPTYIGGLDATQFADVLKRCYELSQSIFEVMNGEGAFSDGCSKSKVSLKGTNTRNGKTIEEERHHRDLLNRFPLPKNKGKKKRVEKVAKKFNVTPQEVLLCSDPYILPHPYILKKTKGKIPSLMKTFGM